MVALPDALGAPTRVHSVRVPTVTASEREESQTFDRWGAGDPALAWRVAPARPNATHDPSTRQTPNDLLHSAQGPPQGITGGKPLRSTRPYRPQTNGKAERFIKTLLNEWAYARLYRSNTARLDALPHWLTYYNHDRHHTALDGLSPTRALVNKARGNHS